MYIYTYMDTDMHAYIHTYIYTGTHTRSREDVPTGGHTKMRIHTFKTHTHTHTHTQTYIQAYIYSCMHAHVCMHTYIRNICIFIYTDIHIYVDLLFMTVLIVKHCGSCQLSSANAEMCLEHLLFSIPFCCCYIHFITTYIDIYTYTVTHTVTHSICRRKQ